MRILVVEDEPSNRKLASLVLTDGGHAVVDASSAEQAIELVVRTQPQIILLDLALPDIDGLAVARRLKQDPATRHIPVIAVTGFPESFPRDQAFQAGCDAYIVKPINTREFTNQVEAVAERHK